MMTGTAQFEIIKTHAAFTTNSVTKCILTKINNKDLRREKKNNNKNTQKQINDLHQEEEEKEAEEKKYLN